MKLSLCHNAIALWDDLDNVYRCIECGLETEVKPGPKPAQKDVIDYKKRAAGED